MTKQWSLDKVCDEHGYDEVEKMESDPHQDFIRWLDEKYSEKTFSVLDVGCCSGRLLKFLPDTLETYIGVDINNKSIMSGKEYFSDNPKAEFHLFDIEDDNIQDIVNEGIDIIYFDSTFTMLQNPFECLGELFKFCNVVYFARTPYTDENTSVSGHQWAGMDTFSENWKFSKADLEKIVPTNWNLKPVSTNNFIIEKSSEV